MQLEQTLGYSPAPYIERYVSVENWELTKFGSLVNSSFASQPFLVLILRSSLPNMLHKAVSPNLRSHLV